MATILHQRTTVDGIFKIGICRNTKCDILVGFPKSGHNWYLAVPDLGGRGAIVPSLQTKGYKSVKLVIQKCTKHINSCIKSFSYFTKYDDPYLQELHTPHPLLHLLHILFAYFKNSSVLEDIIVVYLK